MIEVSTNKKGNTMLKIVKTPSGYNLVDKYTGEIVDSAPTLVDIKNLKAIY